MNDYEEYSTSKWVEFENEDIIIIDPCYALDHEKCDKMGACYLASNGCKLTDYSKLHLVGIHKYITRPTITGDCSGYVYDSDTNECIGQYGVDSAHWGVFSVRELLESDPSRVNFFDCFTHMCTIIPNFTGKVRIETHYRSKMREWDTEDDKLFDSIVGIGTTNFYTVEQSYSEYPVGLSEEQMSILEKYKDKSKDYDVDIFSRSWKDVKRIFDNLKYEPPKLTPEQDEPMESMRYELAKTVSEVYKIPLDLIYNKEGESNGEKSES